MPCHIPGNRNRSQLDRRNVISDRKIKLQSDRRFRWPTGIRRDRKASRTSRTGAGPRLTALDRTVPADLRLCSPTVSVAVVEDAYLALTRLAWMTQRPPLWRRRQWQAWRAEGALLDAKRQRIAELVALGTNA